jgi:Type I phosphodiesterase / nucleotide pyrophosphatase
MKVVITLFCILLWCYLPAQQNSHTAENIFIITTDGFRWQEVFNGADSVLVSSTNYTADTLLTKLQYWDEDRDARRKKLLPFFWNVIAKKGQLLGNRNFNNKVNAANLYKFSYPGYNEILTGYTDPLIFSNKAVVNPNRNILEHLNESETFKGKVVAFSSWSLFPFILGKERNDLPVYSGYETLPDTAVNPSLKMLDLLQDKVITQKTATRYDAVTFLSAKEYIKTHEPKVVLIALGETDEWAHSNRYDHYLQHAAEVDKMIADLWYFIQTHAAYKNNTTLLITTDHGRGRKAAQWKSHGILTAGSGQTWMAAIGTGISARGELKEPEQYYQKQIAATIAALLGIDFTADHAVAAKLNFNNN